MDGNTISRTMNRIFESGSPNTTEIKSMDDLAIESAVESLQSVMTELRTTDHPWRDNQWYSDDSPLESIIDAVEEYSGEIIGTDADRVDNAVKLLAATVMYLMRVKLIEAQQAPDTSLRFQ